MRPTRDNLLITTARLWARRSTCSRLHVGTVISRNGRILVQGYNGAPATLPHCIHRCDCGVLNPLVQHASDCGVNRPCTVSVHAEANAIAFSAKWGVALEGTQLHSTHAPCYNCCMLIINAGITHVVFAEKHRDMTGMSLLHDAGIQIQQLSGMII